MHQLNVTLAVIGVVVLAVGLLSNPIKKSLVQEPMIAVAAGVLVGPFGLAWLDTAAWGDERSILEAGSRLTLAIALMAVALRLDKPSVMAMWRPTALLLVGGMLGMWFATSALAGWLLGLSLWYALILGAALTPTDPVVASSIVTGKFARQHLPPRIRHLLSAESGANDGLAYAILFLPILLMSHPGDEALLRWAIDRLAIGVLGAAIVGAVLGYAAAKLLDLARGSRLIENYSYISFTVALSLFILGVASLLGTDALIAVFVAGVIFNFNIDVEEEHEEENIQEAVAKLFTLPMFVVFGAALPFSSWLTYGWPLAGLAVLVLFARRLPIVGLLAPALKPWSNGRDSAYIGWFGPIGIAAVYYASVAWGHTGDPMFWHVASAAIFASIIVHGATAAPFSRLYSRRPGKGPPIRLKDEAG